MRHHRDLDEGTRHPLTRSRPSGTPPAARAVLPYVLVAVAGITFAAFWPALDAGFVSWDDEANLVNNPAYRGLGLAQLRWMWTTFHLGHWMPLSWMSFGLDHVLWEMDPRGYHLTSLVLHAAAAALLAALIERLLRRGFGDTAGAQETVIPLAAGIAALTWSVHPLRVESVAWITERRDVLSGCLALASVWWYVGSGEGGTGARRRYMLSVAAFAAALLSKATVLTLPALLFLAELYPLRRLPGTEGWFGMSARRIYLRLVPFALLSLASASTSVIALGEVEQLPVAGKVAVSAYSLAFYSLKTLIPTGLAPLYLMPEAVDPFAAQFVLSLAVALVLCGAALLAWRRWPAITVAWFAFVAALSPMLGVRQNGYHIAADRYTYHAAPALAVLLAALLVVLLRWRRGAVLAGCAALVVALAAATARQTAHWHDSESLWRRALDTGNGGWIAHNSYGNALMARGLAREAEAEYRRALALNPRYAEAHNDLGVALSRLDRAAEAETAFRQAIALKAGYAAAMVNLGVLRSRQGAQDEAIALYAGALRLEPDNVAAEVSWGNAMLRLARPAEAIPHYERALALDAGHPQARENLDVARRMLASPPPPAPR